MTPSGLLTIITAVLFSGAVVAAAYLQTPWTPRRVERRVKAGLPVVVFIGYGLTLIAAVLAAIGQ